MSGTVHVPPQGHACAPGWTWTPVLDNPPAGLLLLPGGKGGSYGRPPSPQDYPRGAVWACDCGRTWVSRGRCPACWQVHFRREGYFAQRRRERGAR